ncbi:MAG: hypothetical protein IPG45_20545 [Deltaproteobacteria bacterium]|nr:hypothetical protein [Deltaproteobacteria bacterium]
MAYTWTRSALWGLLPTLIACGSTPTVIDGTDAGDAGDAGVLDTGPRDFGVLDTGVNEYPEAFKAGRMMPTQPGIDLDYDTLDGWAGVMLQTTLTTDVMVTVTGLNPNTQYTAHVHDRVCDDQAGGAHYKRDRAITVEQEDNELWVTISADANGAGTGTLRADHYARADAQSVVIHQPATGERIGCATLYATADVTARGDFVALPDGAALGLAGTGTLRRYQGGTVARIRLTGNLAAQTYPAHVHAKTCADEAGGPHYKIDPTVAETVEANEIWINGERNGAMAEGANLVPHVARYDAWSIVVHDPGNNNRILCADLRW